MSGGHHHGHDHSHSHGQGHHHGANMRAVGLAALLTGGFMLVEVAGGVISGSLALIADAGHMLTDFAALLLAWLAFRMARRPADTRRTYGFDRLSVLAAFGNGVALFAIAIWITVEAVQRLVAPHEIASGLMLAVAVAGLVVNLITFRILAGGDRSNLNMRAAFLHVVGDLLGSVAAIAAALIIRWTGWTSADPLLSVLVAALILRSAWAVVRDSGHILLEGAPAAFDAKAVARDLCAEIPEVAEVRHLHAWSITQQRPMVTLEAVLREGADPEAVRRRIKARLGKRFGFDHATVEMLRAGIGDEALPAAERAPI